MAEHRGEVDPVHVLHGDVVAGRTALRGVDPTEVEDLDDVGVRQPHRELRLLHEHVHELFVGRELGHDALDDQNLLEAFDAKALGLVDVGHASPTELLQQSVAPKGALGVGGVVPPHVRHPPPSWYMASAMRNAEPSS
jgi:hypothetical protein